MKCPYCKNKHPSDVTVCTCGYKFTGYVKSKKQEKENVLSKKYAILHILKSILLIVLVFYIVGSIMAIPNVAFNISGIGGWEILIIGIVGIVWIFGLFGIYCAIKIIDFIFDLDKHKSDKE